MTEDMGASADADCATPAPPEAPTGLRHSGGIASAEEKRLKALAREHFRNASRLATRLVHAELEIERLRRSASQ